MRGIGIFVALLLVAGGVTMYAVTRPPDRTLDAEGAAWVEGFTAWRADTARRVDRAEVEIGVTRGERLSPRLTKPLRDCTASLERLGTPPAVLEDVLDAASSACREVGYALSVHARFGRPALATTKQHLHRAGSWLAQAELVLYRRLGSDEP